jgi:type III restriction enzyme
MPENPASTPFEVDEPILNSPYEPPGRHWYLRAGEAPVKREGRRPSIVFLPTDQREPWDTRDGILAPARDYTNAFELTLVNRVRERLDAWRKAGWPGATRTTLELLEHWSSPDRDLRNRLFFAQREAAESVIFLAEAREDFRQGVAVPMDEPGPEKLAQGCRAFVRHACKMATGSGKTTVMGMLAAWSILNKVNDRSDGRFSDVVLIVCPNVTIRDRLAELDPQRGDASLYRTRDLVPKHFMPALSQGRVLVTNWHGFERQTLQTGGVSARVSKRGKAETVEEWVILGDKTTFARGKRYMTLGDFEKALVSGRIELVQEERADDGSLARVRIRYTEYFESDTAWLQRVLGDAAGKQNILVMNDEAHHAYRIRPTNGDEESEDEDDDEYDMQEATVWVDGLDRIHKHRGINLCVDLSATPYFLNRVNKDANKPFPWVVSDFGLVDAIESGLVKIPQLPIRDTTGDDRAKYFNIWRWIMDPNRPNALSSTERGGRRGNPKPEAILKWADTPIKILGGEWRETLNEWKKKDEARPPVYILVCKNTKIAKVIYEWLAEGNTPGNLPPADLPDLLNGDGKINTIRVDSKVVHETDGGGAKSDEHRWMRFTLDTVGRTQWPTDLNGNPIYPAGFAELAQKLERPVHPPGRDVRCIVSVGMLTEGWDCNTVTHIIGIRPFMSQLLCEQVIGRGLRRASYKPNADGKLNEEVSKVFGVPFEIIPFKSGGGGGPPPPKVHRVYARPDRVGLEIKFPRVEGYTFAIRNRVAVNWEHVAPVKIDPLNIPPEVEVKGLNVTEAGRLSFTGPSKTDMATLEKFRQGKRVQEIVFDLASGLVRRLVNDRQCEVPAQALFPQLLPIVDRYLREKVTVIPPNDLRDAAISPYYQWIADTLSEAIRPDTSAGEAPELPVLEANRGEGRTREVDGETSREVREVNKSHINRVVLDTKQWEQSAAYYLDTHPKVESFVKNWRLGFGIPYLADERMRTYEPDFIVRCVGQPNRHLILETKMARDEFKEAKRAAALRWCAAVTASVQFGEWLYEMVSRPEEVREAVKRFSAGIESTQRGQGTR